MHVEYLGDVTVAPTFNQPKPNPTERYSTPIQNLSKEPLFHHQQSSSRTYWRFGHFICESRNASLSLLDLLLMGDVDFTPPPLL